MFELSRRLLAAVVALSVLPAGPAICAAWGTGPEARMACCHDADSCPMHPDRSEDPRSEQVASRAVGGDCCAASDPGAPESPPAGPVVPITVEGAPGPTPALLREPVLHLQLDRVAFVVFPSHVPRYLLLSTLLV